MVGVTAQFEMEAAAVGDRGRRLKDDAVSGECLGHRSLRPIATNRNEARARCAPVPHSMGDAHGSPYLVTEATQSGTYARHRYLCPAPRGTGVSAPVFMPGARGTEPSRYRCRWYRTPVPVPVLILGAQGRPPRACLLRPIATNRNEARARCIYRRRARRARAQFSQPLSPTYIYFRRRDRRRVPTEFRPPQSNRERGKGAGHGAGTLTPKGKAAEYLAAERVPHRLRTLYALT